MARNIPVANNVDGSNVPLCRKLNYCLTYSTVGTILYDGVTCNRKRGAGHRVAENWAYRSMSLHWSGNIT